MVATESAVVVLVPQAETAVGVHRARLDRAATWGVPAHVTVVYPFVPPDRLGPEELEQLSHAVLSVLRFDAEFTDVRWFGDDVVWVAPCPADGFRNLTAAVVAAFPDHRPYGGAYEEPVPHLTVGAHAPRSLLSTAGEAVAAMLPFSTSVITVHVLQGFDAPGAWRSVAELPLGIC